jgi:hypothetical protein
LEEPAQEAATSAEKRLQDAWSGAGEVHLCAPQGEDCAVVDPAEAAQWGEDRTIRAEFLRSLLVSAGTPTSVRLHGARIDGALDLSWLAHDVPLAFVDCAFEQPLQARSARFAGLDLTGSHLPGIDAAGLQARGRVVLDRVRVSGRVLLQECRLQGSLWCRDAVLQRPEGQEGSQHVPALDLYLARIEGELDLSRSTCTGEVLLLGATIGGQLNCNSGTFTNPDGDALSADGANITGGVFLHNGFTATGEVRLLGARIGGPLDCNSGTFTNPDGDALSADQATITGGVFLNNGFTATGEVRLLGATIGGPLDCTAARSRTPMATRSAPTRPTSPVASS